MSLKNKLNHIRQKDNFKIVNDEYSNLKILNNLVLPYIITQILSFILNIFSFFLDENDDKLTNKLRQLFIPLTILYFICFIVCIDQQKNIENYLILCFSSMVFQIICLGIFLYKNYDYYDNYIYFFGAILIELSIPIGLMLSYMLFKLYKNLDNYLKEPILPMKIK